MYTERDQAIIDYLDTFKTASTSTLIQLFFQGKYRYGAKRLAELAARGDVTRNRSLGENYDYVYYLGRKPKQLIHSLLLTDFHRELSKIAKVHKIIPEYTCGHVRADALATFWIQGQGQVAFVEVQTRNFALDTGKYRQLLLSGDWKQHFPVFPVVIAITDQKIKAPADYKLVHVKTSLNLVPLLSLAPKRNPVVQVFRQGSPR